MSVRLITQALQTGRFSWAAGEAISANRVLTVDAQGAAIYLDPSVSGYQVVLGLAVTAAALGDAVTVARGDRVDDSAWSWAPNQPIWCGAGGVLTQTVPETGYLIKVAEPLTPTKIQVDFVEYIGL